MTGRLAIIYAEGAWRNDCPLCRRPVITYPARPVVVAVDEGGASVCDDCTQHTAPGLWDVLQVWRTAKAGQFRQAIIGGRPPSKGDDFDTDFWREALR